MSNKLEILVLMENGGPLMWVIFVAAFMAFTLLILQAIKLYMQLKYARDDCDRLMENESLDMHENNDSVIAIIERNIAKLTISNEADLTKEINLQLATVIPRLEGSLPTISIIGSLLPMLGLLGTVTGMINVFEVIALQGNGNPEAMAEGISQALLTTASGLMFAIPVVFFHHLLVKKVEQVISVVSQAVQLMSHNRLNIIKGN